MGRPLKETGIGKFIWKLGDTIKGKTKVGQALHQMLPAKKARSFIGELIKGTKSIAPVPEIKAPELREKIEEAIPKLKSANDKAVSEDQVRKVISDLLDLLDDGTINGSRSFDDLSPKWKKRINVGWQFILVAIGAYQVYANWDEVVTFFGF